jgi:hypothetical protein
LKEARRRKGSGGAG